MRKLYIACSLIFAMDEEMLFSRVLMQEHGNRGVRGISGQPYSNERLWRGVADPLKWTQNEYCILFLFCSSNCTNLDKSILRKVIKIAGTRYHISKLKYQIRLRLRLRPTRGFTPDPDGGAYSAPQTIAGFKGRGGKAKRGGRKRKRGIRKREEKRGGEGRGGNHTASGTQPVQHP